MEMVVFSLVLYFVVSLIAFMLIWKNLEKDHEKSRRLPKDIRILCRLSAILFWPVYVIPLFLLLIDYTLRRIYESIVK